MLITSTKLKFVKKSLPFPVLRNFRRKTKEKQKKRNTKTTKTKKQTTNRKVP